MLCAIAPFTEDVWTTDKSLISLSWYNPEVLAYLLGSGVLAFFVNLSIFLVIGRTSPVSYNVLGHAKLCTILLSGWLFFGEQCSAGRFLGIVMALGGVFSY